MDFPFAQSNQHMGPVALVDALFLVSPFTSPGEPATHGSRVSATRADWNLGLRCQGRRATQKAISTGVTLGSSLRSGSSALSNK